MKRFAFLCAVLAAIASAQDGPCVIDGGAWYRHADLGGGTTRVTEVSEWFPTGAQTETPRGDVTRAELQAYYQGLLRDSALVFLGRIDSVIQLSAGDTSKPLAPWKTLALGDTLRGIKYFRFYARIQVDTVLRGTLPASFWIEGKRREACQFDWRTFKGKTFLNASASFEKMSDLKLELAVPWSFQVLGHWFEGRYLTTPPYYGVRIDITHMLPTYPATGIASRRLPFAPPLRNSGKAWLPNGREAMGLDARRSPLPVLK